MNKATKEINQLFNNYCSLDSIARITHSRYFCNAIINFNQGFRPYLKRNYHVEIIKYQDVLEELRQSDHSANESELSNLCLLKHKQFRFLNTNDVGIIKAIIRKYYQDSGEINLRICLLLQSKMGTRYLSRITEIPGNKISMARHNLSLINKFSLRERITLENLYLNSEFALHLNKLKIHFKI